ncbi:MAG TPA: GNAT family N-acetyltransferase [Acidimicrobiales bacterium]|jgi:predicted acetyltransferase|nr:GNAT family N-acetyltransferase [Acidimicrobiales bacterium]
MDLELRTIGAGEVGAFVDSLSVPFLDAGDPTVREHWGPHVEPDRAWAVVEHGRFVANACAFTRNVTVPGSAPGCCPTLPIAAVSGVGVHPTHRRRGLLRRLMGALIDDARRRGEPLAGLQASEGAIYGRFGFGQATWSAQVVVDTSRAALASPVPGAGVRLLDAHEAAKTLPDLHDRLRRGRAGEVDRDAATWAGILADPIPWRKGGSALYYAVSDDGYAAYRGHELRDNGALVGARLELRDLYATTAEAEAALWRYLFDVDLVREVSALHRPVDDALRWRLVDPRQFRVTLQRDMLWLRILDVAAALEARGYRREGRLVLEVVGDDPEVAGRWRLDASRAGASCRRAAPGEPAGVTLPIAELGAVYLGGVTPSTLAAAGRVVEGRKGALDLADSLFATVPAPFSGTLF